MSDLQIKKPITALWLIVLLVAGYSAGEFYKSKATQEPSNIVGPVVEPAAADSVAYSWGMTYRALPIAAKQDTTWRAIGRDSCIATIGRW